MKFNVSDVKLANDKINEVCGIKKAFQSMLGDKIESCEQSDESIIRSKGHGFVNTVHRSFADHYPLVISPDDIWLLAVQGLSNCVNEDPEGFRNIFVKHEGKQLIRIIRNEFIRGNINNHWEGCFEEFAQKIKGYIGEQYDKISCKFSTTTDVISAANNVAIMDVVKNYFEYRVRTMCGIPSIELSGTSEDWEKLLSKLESWECYKLEWWMEKLIPVAEEFVNTSHGNINLDFWKSFYKYQSGSGGESINGHILAFFPYRLNGSKMARNSFRSLTIGSIPTSLSQVDFIWEYYGKEIPMKFIAGFLGSTQDENLSLKSKISWAVSQHEIHTQ